MAKPYLKTSCWFNFFVGASHAVGVSKAESGTLTAVDNSNGFFTKYATAASLGAVANVYTPPVITKRRQNFSSSFVFMLSDLADSTKWVGLTGGDLSGKKASDLGPTFGFPLVSLIFEQGQLGSGDMAFVFDSGTSSGAIFIVPSLVPTSVNSVYQLDVVSLGTGGIKMTLSIIAGDNVGKIQSWTSTSSWIPQTDSLMGMFASVTAKVGSSAGLLMKSMYLEQD
jgi:hypothetical protein